MRPVMAAVGNYNRVSLGELTKLLNEFRSAFWDFSDAFDDLKESIEDIPAEIKSVIDEALEGTGRDDFEDNPTLCVIADILDLCETTERYICGYNSDIEELEYQCEGIVEKVSEYIHYKDDLDI